MTDLEEYLEDLEEYIGLLDTARKELEHKIKDKDYCTGNDIAEQIYYACTEIDTLADDINCLDDDD